MTRRIRRYAGILAGLLGLLLIGGSTVAAAHHHDGPGSGSSACAVCVVGQHAPALTVDAPVVVSTTTWTLVVTAPALGAISHDVAGRPPGRAPPAHAFVGLA